MCETISLNLYKVNSGWWFQKFLAQPCGLPVLTHDDEFFRVWRFERLSQIPGWRPPHSPREPLCRATKETTRTHKIFLMFVTILGLSGLRKN